MIRVKARRAIVTTARMNDSAIVYGQLQLSEALLVGLHGFQHLDKKISPARPRLTLSPTITAGGIAYYSS
jgi:hypothetical protein